MIFPGNGAPVTGSLMITGTRLKSPPRRLGSGIERARLLGERSNLVSQFAKKNKWFFNPGAGPPTVAPNWLMFRLAAFTPRALSDQFCAASLLLRLYS